jgi:hypothetical protein
LEAPNGAPGIATPVNNASKHIDGVILPEKGSITPFRF